MADDWLTLVSLIQLSQPAGDGPGIALSVWEQMLEKSVLGSFIALLVQSSA